MLAPFVKQYRWTLYAAVLLWVNVYCGRDLFLAEYRDVDIIVFGMPAACAAARKSFVECDGHRGDRGRRLPRDLSLPASNTPQLAGCAYTTTPNWTQQDAMSDGLGFLLLRPNCEGSCEIELFFRRTTRTAPRSC